ncbi:MAG TPA: hypothetical protein ENN40_11305 [Candidatus Aminicenantes bacterium]|nr:hypothetical protein [Candidatus Aminicenantes bacterium]
MTSIEDFQDYSRLRSGITVVELLVTVIVLGIILCSGVLGMRAYHRRADAANGVRCVTAAMQAARYRAIKHNRRVRLSQNKAGNLELEVRKNGNWHLLEQITIPAVVEFRLNADPVFYPEGHVVPLCSAFVSVGPYQRKISISLAGRIKVTPLP